MSAKTETAPTAAAVTEDLKSPLDARAVKVDSSEPVAAANGKKTDAAKVEVKAKPDQSARVDEIMKRIAEQVEFYLGDFNLNQDKFFRDLVTTGEGWVPLEAILKCNRVKKYTSNPEDVTNSLRKFSQLELDESGQKVRRKEAFLQDTEETRADRDPRTVFVKRFLKTATIDGMQEYFRKFGPIDGLVLNKFQEGDAKLRGKWKGSVQCIFKNKADAEAYLAAPEESAKFDGKEMLRFWKADHLVEKEQHIVSKKKEIEDSKIPGSVLHLSCQRQINYLPIREYFEKLSPVAYLDCQTGQREARVRFRGGVAKEVLDGILAKNNNKIVVEGVVYKGRVLEGKEEKAYFDTYWDTYLQTKNNRILRTMRPFDPKSQFKFNSAKPTGKGSGKEETKPANGDSKKPAKPDDANAEKREAAESKDAVTQEGQVEGTEAAKLKSESPAKKRTVEEPESETASKKVKADDA